MTEQEFITQESAKERKRLVRNLRRIQTTGECGNDLSETLWLNNLIHFGPPREGIKYNCWHLTPDALALIARNPGGKTPWDACC